METIKKDYLLNTDLTMKVIPYGRQNITQEDIDAVVEALTSDFLTQGPRISEFEKRFAEYIGCKFAVAVANGTAALHLAAIALGVNDSSRVITSPITFAASANCILYCGGKIEFCDIDADSYLLDLQKLEALLKSKPAGYYHGIIPVDFAGYAVDLEKLKYLAKKYKLWILEDACHAPGGYFSDSNSMKRYCGDGAFADLAIFSFHPVKHIATGEGGMITTNSRELYEKLLILRTHGITKTASDLHENHGGWYYEMQTLGYNYRLTDIQAALGISQLHKAVKGLERRREIANAYDQAFQDLPITLPKPTTNVSHAFHLYVVQVENRLRFYNYLHENNIKAQVHYVPVHTMPYYKNLGWEKGDFPVAEAYYEKCLSLPMYPTLSQEELDYIIQKVRTFFNSNH
jgi:UDP-4-amino-4,6-dideoxy-N-acetyl-beta-L-altrosamine transaminase